MQPLPAPRWEHTFVLMMEVLDNLPHDRWVWGGGGGRAPGRGAGV